MVTVHVSANLYSGRENPGWDLRPAEVAYFVSHLQHLPASKVGPSGAEGGLGYSGLAVTVHSGPVVQQYIVSAGIVSEANGKDRRVLEDRSSELESWLVKTGEQALGPDTMGYVLGVIGHPPTGR